MHMTSWIKAAGLRAVRTVAQTAVALIGTAVIVTDVEWQTVLSGSILAGLLSLLTSVATDLPELNKELPPPAPSSSSSASEAPSE